LFAGASVRRSGSRVSPHHYRYRRYSTSIAVFRFADWRIFTYAFRTYVSEVACLHAFTTTHAIIWCVLYASTTNSLRTIRTRSTRTFSTVSQRTSPKMQGQHRPKKRLLREGEITWKPENPFDGNITATHISRRGRESTHSINIHPSITTHHSILFNSIIQNRIQFKPK
jgi:hypothetical protein